MSNTEQMVIVPGLPDEDLRHLRRFKEICDDSDAGGHDLPNGAVKRLEQSGALRNCGFGRHEITTFGEALLEQSAAKPQGEPVAPVFVMPSNVDSYGFGYVDGTCIQSLRGYRDHLEEIVDSIPEGPLFTHADAGELERLQRRIQNADLALKVQTQNCNTYRDQLAERDARLHKLKETLQREYWDEYAGLEETRELIDAPLSVSAEPTAPVPSLERLREEVDAHMEVARSRLLSLQKSDADLRNAKHDLAAMRDQLAEALLLTEKVMDASIGTQRKCLSDLRAHLFQANANSEPAKEGDL